MTTQRGYKRSWKNLLINKRYQLRFTLFMVGLAGLLMALLGWWVVRVAGAGTSVAQSRLRGLTCPGLPEAVSTAVVVDSGTMTFDDGTTPTDGGAGAGTGSGTGAGSGTDAAPAPTDDAGAGAGSETGSGSGAETGTGTGTGDDVPTGVHRITMDEPSMTLKPVTVRLLFPESFVPDFVEHVRCELDRSGQIAELDQGQRNIKLVLILSGVAIVIGLVLFGIKMTHRVAGPLYKVTLYLAKLRDGRYDRVYDLRKGDQLVEFYEHFKQAHAGVVALEQGDRDRIAAALDAAAADGVLERSPEARSAADELRAILDRKEKALGQK